MITGRSNNAYQVSIPQLPNNSFNFNFTVAMPDGTYQFFFNYMPSNVENVIEPNWYFYGITPSGDIRWGMVNPNSTCWSRYPDVGVYFQSSLQTIGQNDLSNVTMYLLYWTS